jgi:hypothetical protein
MIDVVLNGSGVPGKLSAPKTFGIKGSVGQIIHSNLTIRNIGKGLLSGTWPTVTAGPYSLAGGSFGPLQKGATATIPITFAPTAKGNAEIVDLPIMVTEPSIGDMPVALRGVGK